jgi:hypothetical protein
MLLSARAVGMLQRRFPSLVAAFALVQAVVLVAARPGVLSIDEVTYLAMARSAARGNLVSVENGWELGPSPELQSDLVRDVGGRLVAQYPAGFALLSAPFYVVLGASAMFALNTAAFYATVLLTRRIARRMLGSERLALLAAVLFGCATFAWEYSAAIWPHAIATLLTTAAMDAALAAAAESSPSRAVRHRLLAGAFVGAATTIRLDAVFVIPALLLVPLVLDRSAASLWHAGTLLAGTIPAVVFLVATNHVKFETWMPFSYGPWQGQGSNTGASSYAILGALAAAALLAAHVGARRPLLFDRKRVLLAFAACVAATLLIEPARNGASRTLTGLWSLVVDLRYRDLSWLEAALTRSPRGGMIYIGTFKKSLLQSCPYLALVPLSVLAAWADPRARRRRLALLLPIAAYTLVFAYFRWHGGLSVNLRYFVPILPFVAVLSADGLARLARLAVGSLRVLRIADVVVLAGAAVYIETVVLLRLPTAPLATREVFYLDVPLALASALAGAILVASFLGRGRARSRVSAVAFVLAVATLTWGGLTELTYDAVAVAKVRIRGHVVAARARRHIAAGSIVFVDYLDPAAGLLEDGVVLATGPRDAFGDTARLVDASVCRGRRAYAMLTASSLASLRIATESRLEVRIIEERDGLVTADLVPLVATDCPR